MQSLFDDAVASEEMDMGPLPQLPPRPRLPMNPSIDNPSVGRAWGRVSKRLPEQARQVGKIRSLYQETDPLVKGSVPIDNPGMNEIYVNPIYAGVAPEAEIEKTLAHELKHVSDFQVPGKLEGILRSLGISYRRRPHEVAAFAQEEDYANSYLRGQKEELPKLKGNTWFGRKW